MKQHIQYSPDAETNSGASEPVKRLANRYNIPEKDVEALLYGSRAPKSETLGSRRKEIPMADEFRSNYGEPPRRSGWSPVNVLSAIVGVLGIMALTIILISVIHREHFYHMGEGISHPPPSTTAPNPQHSAIQDSALTTQTGEMNQKAEEVPLPAASNEITSKPKTKVHRNIVRRFSGGFSTSNSIEAQERLAEMRADGNKKAKIHGGTKNGVTIYTVK